LQAAAFGDQQHQGQFQQRLLLKTVEFLVSQQGQRNVNLLLLQPFLHLRLVTLAQGELELGHALFHHLQESG